MNNTSQTPSYRIILKQFMIQSVLFVGLFVILFSFQNCSQDMAGNEDLSSLGKELPFAFDSKVDHLAYMSCAAAGFDTNAFFTAKVGAYNAGSGLKFTDGARAKLAPLSAELAAQALAASTVNAGLVHQVAIRSNSDYQQYYTASGYGNFITTLSDANVSNVLKGLSSGGRANVFTTLPAASQKFEGRLLPTANEGLAQAVRDALHGGSGVLAMTYNQPAYNATYAMGANLNSTSSVYGSGLAVQFKLPSGYFSGPARTLSSVSERNLSNGSAVSGAWSCSSNHVFKIVRGIDRGTKTICNVDMNNEPSTASMTTAQLDAYNTIRKVLPAQYWAIDVVNKCVVLKTGIAGSCYGSESTALNIQYNAGTSCTAGAGNCPHFVSVCKKS